MYRNLSHFSSHVNEIFLKRITNSFRTQHKIELQEKLKDIFSSFKIFFQKKGSEYMNQKILFLDETSKISWPEVQLRKKSYVSIQEEMEMRAHFSLKNSFFSTPSPFYSLFQVPSFSKYYLNNFEKVSGIFIEKNRKIRWKLSNRMRKNVKKKLENLGVKRMKSIQ